MRQLKTPFAFLVVYTLLLSFVPASRPAMAQDLVPSDSISGGSSAFVFNGSSKKPQLKLAGGYAFLGEGGGRSGSVGRSNAQIAAAAKKKRAAAAAARRKAIIDAANAKIKASNKLTRSAETALEAGQTDAAIKDFRAALVQNPKNTRAAIGLSEGLTDKAAIVAGSNNNIAAAPLLEEAIKYDRTNSEAYAKLGAVYDVNGDKIKAIPNYEKAIALDPELAGLNAPLGMAYLDKGDIAKAGACSTKADAANIDTVESRMLKGLVMLKQNRNDEALAAFDRVIQLDPRNASALYYRGQAYDRLDQKDNSIASYKKAVEIEPGYAPASYDLGVAYYNAGDYKNAETSYQQTLKADPDNAQAAANLASTYRQLERYADANVQYNKASAKMANNGDLYSEWGFCLGKANEWDKSAARLIRANELTPIAISTSNVSWAYYNYAVIQTDQNVAKSNLELSRSFAEKAVAQDPKLDAAYLNLGSTQNRLGNFQAAVVALKFVLGFRSDGPIATFAGNQLGIGYRGLGELDNAVAIFKQITDRDSTYANGLFNLGEAYNANGDKKAAKKVQDRLKKLDPRLAGVLSDVFSGKIPMPGLGGAGVSIPKVVPKVPKVPKLPY